MNTEASDFPIDNARMLRAANKEIADLKDTIEKKEVAFKLITAEQHREIKALKEALKDALIHWRNKDDINDFGCFDLARKLIED